MKKITFVLALVCALIIALTACGSKEPSDNDPGSNTDNQQTVVTGIFEGPVLIVSAGQSADASIAKSLMTKAGVDYTVYEEGASIDGFKTAMIVPGVSVKGLGAAGIAVEDELAATKDLVGKLDNADIKIMVAHLGGSSRRDELTDQFIDAVLPYADYVCALQEGNKDNKFSDFATAGNIPFSIEKDTVSMVSTVTGLFTK